MMNKGRENFLFQMPSLCYAFSKRSLIYDKLPLFSMEVVVCIAKGLELLLNMQQLAGGFLQFWEDVDLSMAFPTCAFVPLRLSGVGGLASNSPSYLRCKPREAGLEETSLHFHIQHLHEWFPNHWGWWLCFLLAPQDDHSMVWKCEVSRFV